MFISPLVLHDSLPPPLPQPSVPSSLATRTWQDLESGVGWAWGWWGTVGEERAWEVAPTAHIPARSREARAILGLTPVTSGLLLACPPTRCCQRHCLSAQPALSLEVQEPGTSHRPAKQGSAKKHSDELQHVGLLRWTDFFLAPGSSWRVAVHVHEGGKLCAVALCHAFAHDICICVHVFVSVLDLDSCVWACVCIMH